MGLKDTILNEAQKNELCQQPLEIAYYIVDNSTQLQKILGIDDDLEKLMIPYINKIPYTGIEKSDVLKEQVYKLINNNELGIKIRSILEVIRTHITKVHIEAEGNSMINAISRGRLDAGEDRTLAWEARESEIKVAKKTLDLLAKLFVKDGLIYESRTFFDWMLAMTQKERNTLEDLLKYDRVLREGTDFKNSGQVHTHIGKGMRVAETFVNTPEYQGSKRFILVQKDDGSLEEKPYNEYNDA